MDITGKKPEELRSSEAKDLGTFVTITSEGERTTRTYRLPASKLFVIASVYYDDETLASEKGPDSISLELLASPRRKRDVLRAVSYADAEVPANGFDVARVAMIVRAERRTQVVIMECRQQVSK